jgi:hypothetical protein
MAVSQHHTAVLQSHHCHGQSETKDSMDPAILIADVQKRPGGPAVIHFHDIEHCTQKDSSALHGYYHAVYDDGKDNKDNKDNKVNKDQKAISKGHRLAARAAEILSRHGAATASLEATGRGIVGGAPCKEYAGPRDGGLSWYEKTRFEFCMPEAQGGVLTSTNYLHFSSPLGQIVSDDIYLHGCTIVSGICLFSKRILETSIPDDGPIRPDIVQNAMPTLYEVEFIARAIPVIGDFVAMFTTSSEHRHPSNHPPQIDMNIPSFHYYQSIEKRLQDGTCTFQQALQWVKAVERRHAQIRKVFEKYIEYEISRRGLGSVRVQIHIDPLATWVCSTICQSLAKGIFPSLSAILEELSICDPVWASYLRLIAERDQPKDFRSLGYHFYVYEAVRPALAENVCDQTASSGNPMVAKIPNTARLLIGIDDGFERQVYSRAQKILKRMRGLPSEYPSQFNLLEVYVCRRVFIDGNRTGSNLYLDDPSTDIVKMEECAGVPTNSSNANAEEVSCHKVDFFDVIGKLHGSRASRVLKELFMEVGFGSCA